MFNLSPTRDEKVSFGQIEWYLVQIARSNTNDVAVYKSLRKNFTKWQPVKVGQ